MRAQPNVVLLKPSTAGAAGLRLAPLDMAPAVPHETGHSLVVHDERTLRAELAASVERREAALEAERAALHEERAQLRAQLQEERAAMRATLDEERQALVKVQLERIAASAKSKDTKEIVSRSLAPAAK